MGLAKISEVGHEKTELDKLKPKDLHMVQWSMWTEMLIMYFHQKRDENICQCDFFSPSGAQPEKPRNPPFPSLYSVDKLTYDQLLRPLNHPQTFL